MLVRNNPKLSALITATTLLVMVVYWIWAAATLARPHAEDLWVNFTPQPDITTQELARIVAKVTSSVVVNQQVWAEMPPELKRHFTVLPNPMTLPHR